jgi:hypothetical protein
LAGLTKEVERSVAWLRERSDYQWRSITSLETARPARMGHKYTALTMRAFF